jgi:hypothetical protein
MNDRIPRSQRDHVLVDVKAQPSGWPTASLDPDSGRGPTRGAGCRPTTETQFSGLYGFRGLPAILRHLHAVVTTGQAWDPTIATHGTRHQLEAPQVLCRSHTGRGSRLMVA